MDFVEGGGFTGGAFEVTSSASILASSPLWMKFRRARWALARPRQEAGGNYLFENDEYLQSFLGGPIIACRVLN